MLREGVFDAETCSGGKRWWPRRFWVEYLPSSLRGGRERICGCLIKQEATANAVGEDLVSKIGGEGKIKNPFQLRFEKRRGIDFKNFF